MPTIKTIRPAGGGDYSTLAAWEDWADGQATADQWAECYSGGNLGGLSLFGWTATPDVDNYPLVYAAPGNSHSGNESRGAYVVGTSGPVAIQVAMPFGRVEGLRITYPTGDGIACSDEGQLSGLLVHDCQYNGISAGLATRSVSVDIRNCIVSDCGYGVQASLAAASSSYTSSITVANCSISGCTSSGANFTEYSVGGTATLNVTLANCIAVDAGISDFTASVTNGTITANNNLSSDATADDWGGTGNLINQSSDDVFVDAAAGDFTLKQTSPAVGSGANLYSDFTEDMVGHARAQSGAWDMGALAYQAPITQDDIDRLFDDESTITSLVGYDSRSNRTLSIDPRENTVVTIYDGASRPTMVQQHMRQRGQGVEAPAPGDTLLAYGGATIRSVTNNYDANSRLKQLKDNNGNVTTYEYDLLDRETAMIYNDSSQVTRTYNQAGNVTQLVDNNGSVFENTFDALGRKTQCDITAAVGLVGTTQQTWQYDGASRLRSAIDFVDTDEAEVELVYDSLGRTLEDAQTLDTGSPLDRYVTHTEFTSAVPTQFQFPDTGATRKIDHAYDLLYRRRECTENSGGALIASWEYQGPGRIAEMKLGANDGGDPQHDLYCTMLNNDRTRAAVQADQTTPGWGSASSDRLGYDGASRMVAKRWLLTDLDGNAAYDDTTPVTGFTTHFDRASNKLFERELHAESRSHLYEPLAAPATGGDTPGDGVSVGGYDSIDRLRQVQRGVLSDGTGGSDPKPPGGSVVTPISLPNADESRTYDLDGLGNWKDTTFTPVGGAQTTQKRNHNGLNQITRVLENGPPVEFSYDAPWSPYTTKANALEPFGLWRLNEESGVTADDLTGANDGTYTPNSGSWTGGTLDNAAIVPSQEATSPTADFNGTTGYVDLGTMGNFGSSMGSGVSIAMWLQSDETGTDMCPIGVYAPTSLQVFVNQYGGTPKQGAIFVRMRDSGGNFLRGGVNLDTGITDGRPHHLAVAIDPATDTIAVYIDDVLQPFTYVEQDTLSSLTNFSRSLYIGATNTSGGAQDLFDGTISEVALYNSVLSADDVTALYDAGVDTHRRGNGNLTDDGTRTYEWDAFNRLKQVARNSDGATIGAYTYDALNRRVRKTVSNGGLSGTIPNGTIDLLFNSDWQCVEERDGSNDTYKQYLWGNEYIDSLVQLKTFATINDNAAGVYYPLQDMLYRTMALVDSTGSIVEAYDYDAYGNTLIFTAEGTGPSWWADDATQGDNPTLNALFTGQYCDSETALYNYRNRYYAPELGRFIGRDRINHSTMNNLYLYCESDPTSTYDPSGLITITCHCLSPFGWESGNVDYYVDVQSTGTPADARAQCRRACSDWGVFSGEWGHPDNIFEDGPDPQRQALLDAAAAVGLRAEVVDALNVLDKKAAWYPGQFARDWTQGWVLPVSGACGLFTWDLTHDLVGTQADMSPRIRIDPVFIQQKADPGGDECQNAVRLRFRDVDGDIVTFYLDNGGLGRAGRIFDDAERQEFQNKLNDPTNEFHPFMFDAGLQPSMEALAPVDQ